MRVSQRYQWRERWEGSGRKMGKTKRNWQQKSKKGQPRKFAERASEVSEVAKESDDQEWGDVKLALWDFGQ